MGMRPLACWNCGFESRREHRCLSLVSFVCCQVEAYASGRSLIQRNPTECDVSECDREASIMRRPWPTKGCCPMWGKIIQVSLTLKKSVSVSMIRKTKIYFSPTRFKRLVFLMGEYCSLRGTVLIFIYKVDQCQCSTRCHCMFLMQPSRYKLIKINHCALMKK